MWWNFCKCFRVSFFWYSQSKQNETRSLKELSTIAKSILDAAVIPAFSKPFFMSLGLSFKYVTISSLIQRACTSRTTLIRV